MANKLQTSIRAYAADNIQIKRFLRVEDAQQLFHIEDEVLLIVALSADALYQLPRTTLIHQKKMEDYMKHLYKVPQYSFYPDNCIEVIIYMFPAKARNIQLNISYKVRVKVRGICLEGSRPLLSH